MLLQEIKHYLLTSQGINVILKWKTLEYEKRKGVNFYESIKDIFNVIVRGDDFDIACHDGFSSGASQVG